ncbi:MAG: hypothetical protein SPG79_09805 [Candidatus Faecousia sp.]|nr:hypothetical protein [Candidatus Faecousia sp.]
MTRSDDAPIAMTLEFVKFQFSCLLFYSRQKPGLYAAFRNRGPQGPEIWAHNGGQALARRRKTGKKPGKEM